MLRLKIENLRWDNVYAKNFREYSSVDWWQTVISTTGYIISKTGPVTFTVELTDGRQLGWHQDHMLDYNKNVDRNTDTSGLDTEADLSAADTQLRNG